MNKTCTMPQCDNIAVSTHIRYAWGDERNCCEECLDALKRSDIWNLLRSNPSADEWRSAYPKIAGMTKSKLEELSLKKKLPKWS